MTSEEAKDALKRFTVFDLVNLVALQAATLASQGDPTGMTLEAEARVNGHTAVVRVRIAPKAPKRPRATKESVK